MLPQQANIDPTTGIFTGVIACITTPCPTDNWGGTFNGTTINLWHNFVSLDTNLAYAVDINATVVPVPAKTIPIANNCHIARIRKAIHNKQRPSLRGNVRVPGFGRTRSMYGTT